MANQANTAAYTGSDGRLWVNVDSNKTLTIADSGYVQNVIADAVVVSVPATATQGIWPIRAGGVPKTSAPVGTGDNGSMNLSISPVAADQIQGGPTGSAVDNKDIILTKATMQIGDFATIHNTGETNGPLVASYRGIWTREA
jgi:hypothetical protein